MPWLPILPEPPSPLLPMCEGVGRVAAPDCVRLADAWLVSHCMGILDGDLKTTELADAFGWAEPPRAAVVCAQLVRVGGQWTEDCAVTEEELHDQLLRPAYSQLSELLETPAFAGVSTVMRGRPCVWAGEGRGFFAAEHVAFDGGDALPLPYLCEVLALLAVHAAAHRPRRTRHLRASRLPPRKRLLQAGPRRQAAAAAAARGLRSALRAAAPADGRAAPTVCTLPSRRGWYAEAGGGDDFRRCAVDLRGDS